jgi:hypothetical protein
MLSFARTGDQTILEHVQAIDMIGADVTVKTEENGSSKGTVTREVTIRWQTHSTDPRVLG